MNDDDELNNVNEATNHQFESTSVSAVVSAM